MIPFDPFAKVRPRENDEYAKRDDLLDDFQLIRCEFTIADAIRRNLKTVFGERDYPTHNDYSEERNLTIFQVTVPGNRHKDVRANQKENGFHGARIVARAQSWVHRPATVDMFQDLRRKQVATEIRKARRAAKQGQ